MTFHRPDFLCVCVYILSRKRVHISPLWISNVCFQCDQSVGVESDLETQWLVCFAREAAQEEAARRIVVSLTLFTYAKPSHGISLESPRALSNSSCFKLRIHELFNLSTMMRYSTDKTQTDKVYSCFWCFLFGGKLCFLIRSLFLVSVDDVCGPVRTGSPWWLTIAQVFLFVSFKCVWSFFFGKKAHWGRNHVADWPQPKLRSAEA